MNHRREPLRLHALQPGTFKIRRVKNGPWVAAELRIEGGMISATEDGVPVVAPVALADLPDLLIEATLEGEAFRHPLFRLLYFGVRIDQGEHDHMIATAAWARRHSPHSAAANPTKPVDPGRIPIADLF